MALALAILFLLVIVAVVYGIFFLIFKLGWIIAGKNKNKWPLILAGIATVLLFAVSIISTIMGVNKYIMPIMPLVEKTIQKTDITTGVRPYTDPKYGFTINLFGGTETSDWININNNSSLLLGFDTNIGAISKKNQGQQEAQNFVSPISGLVVYVNKIEPQANVQEYLQEMAEDVVQAQNTQFKLLAEPDYSIPNTVFLEGEGTTQQGRTYQAFVVFAAQDDLSYAVLGFVSGNATYQQMVKDEIRSFRPNGFPAAPVPYNTPFAVPNQEVASAPLPQAAQ